MVFDGRAPIGCGLRELIVSVPAECGQCSKSGGEKAGGHVAVKIVNWIQAADGVILIDGIWRVTGGGAAAGGVGAFTMLGAVADGVEGVVAGAAAGVEVLGRFHFAALVVAPVPVGSNAAKGADTRGGGDGGALANDVHGVIILRNGVAANFVFFEVKQVAISKPRILDDVGGTGDGFDEIAGGPRFVGIAVGRGGTYKVAGDRVETAVSSVVSQR